MQQDILGQSTTPASKKVNADPDLSSLLQHTSTDIKMAMYTISRIVDSGDHHKLLNVGDPIDILICENIPSCCKIDLQNRLGPLIIRVHRESKHDLQIYASFKNSEPSQLEHDFCFTNQHKLVIRDIYAKPVQKK